MLAFITLLLVCQLLGEVAARILDLPLPGPVIGMVLLFVGLTIRGGEAPERLQSTAQGLLEHLSLLFVPAGVGVMLHLSLVAEEWLPITAGLIVSTIATIAVTALVMRAAARWMTREPEAANGDAEQ